MQKQTAKEKVILASQRLMMAQGYTATTVDEIVAAAGVAKGSFYHAFKSKEELALAALDDYFRRGSISTELADNYPNLIARIDSLFWGMEMRIRGILEPALKAKGVKTPSALGLARHLVAVLEGSIIMSKSHRDVKCLHAGISHYRRYINYLLG